MHNACYVYIVLPGETEFVTAGKLVLSTDRHGVPTGRFVYGRRYLARANAVPIDPFELKLRAGTFETRRLKGVFGALRDAGPDYWARRRSVNWITCCNHRMTVPAPWVSV